MTCTPAPPGPAPRRAASQDSPPPLACPAGSRGSSGHQEHSPRLKRATYGNAPVLFPSPRTTACPESVRGWEGRELGEISAASASKDKNETKTSQKGKGRRRRSSSKRVKEGRKCLCLTSDGWTPTRRIFIPLASSQLAVHTKPSASFPTPSRSYSVHVSDVRPGRRPIIHVFISFIHSFIRNNWASLSNNLLAKGSHQRTFTPPATR